MTKTKILRLYTLLSIIVGITLFFFTIDYVNNFTKCTLNFSQTVGEFYGNVSKTPLNVTLSVYMDELVIFNTIGLVSLIVLVLNTVFMIVIGKTDDVEAKLLKEGYQVNFILSLIMFLGSILFIFMIPDKINGAIVNNFIFVKMPVMSGDIAYVINLLYIGVILYTVYNAVVFFKTLPESKTVVDEELYEKEFFTHLEDETEEEVIDDLDE